MCFSNVHDLRVLLQVLMMQVVKTLEYSKGYHIIGTEER